MNKACKTLTSLFFCAATGALLIPAFALNADTKIPIDEDHFPDKVFREYIKQKEKDYGDHDGFISSDEIKNEFGAIYTGNGIKDLTGIEYFTELTVLDVTNSELTTVDLSKNTKLEDLNLNNNKLVELDLSRNTKLASLSCDNNKLTNLDLSKLPDLEGLNCYGNKLKELSLSNNLKLDSLRCGGNELVSLDLSKNIKLKNLYCSDCGLSSLDLSNQPKLLHLFLKGNNISVLDLSNNKKLGYVNLSGNKLKELDLRNSHLYELDCSDNQLENIYYKAPDLYKFICSNNKLKTLDLTTTTKMYDLQCQGNEIDKLDIGKCPYLISAFLGKDEVKNGYTIYKNQSDGHSSNLVVDNSTLIMTDAVDVDDSVKSIDIQCGSVISLNIKNAAQASSVTLKSSNPSIAKIGDNNTVQALKAGSSVVTVTVDGKSYDVKVQVLYKDVKDSSKFWYAPTYALTEMEVVKGYDNQTLFKPANKCTRAQMVTFIWRLAGSPEPKTKECKFSDVKEKDYFYKACIWGNENHIVEGYKDGTFGPQIVCARRHAVTFLWRLAGKPEPNVDKIKFTDVFKDINEDDYFYKACLWASEKKIVAGYDDNTFRPDGDCLRRQMVTFLYKYDKFVNKNV